MIRARLAVGVMLLGTLGVACTVLTLNNLSDTDKLAPAVPPTPPDECGLIEEPDGSNACADCIATKCKDDVEFACTRGEAGTKSWFQSLKDCAQDPYVAFGPSTHVSYRCYEYDQTDAGIISGKNDDHANQVKSEVCVRDQCLRGSGTPPCKLCPVSLDVGNKDPVPLEAEPCGQCIRDKCGAELVRDCQSGSYITTTIKHCAYLADPEQKRQCLDPPSDFDAAGPLHENSASDVNDYQLATCFNRYCRSGCEK